MNATIGTTTRPWAKRAAAACLLFALGASAQTARAADAKDQGNLTRELYRQAAALLAEKKTAEAEAVLEQAWAIARTYDIAASLGEVELRLKQYTEAAAHLA